MNDGTEGITLRRCSANARYGLHSTRAGGRAPRLAISALALLLAATAASTGCRDRDQNGEGDPFAPIPFEAPEKTAAQVEEAAPVEASLGEKASAIYMAQARAVRSFADAIAEAGRLELGCAAARERVEGARGVLLEKGETSVRKIEELLSDVAEVDQDIAWHSMRSAVRLETGTLAEDPRFAAEQLLERCRDLEPLLEKARTDALATLDEISSRVNPRGRDMPPIWRIARAGRKDFYLFGSIHHGSASLFPLPKVVEDAFSEATVMAVEIDPFDLDARTVARILEIQRLPDNKRLADVLSQDLFARTMEKVRKGGIPPEAVERMRPGVVAHMILDSFGGPSGLVAESGMEAVFLRRAREAGKKVVELETAEDQLDAMFFGRFGDQMEIRALETALSMAPEMDGFVLKLVTDWRRGNDEELAKVRTFWQDRDPRLRRYDQALFEQRDAQMTRRILRLMRDDRSHFIMVGAGHLVGEGSIVSRLRARGIEVERL